jgi:hypothetical protein
MTRRVVITALVMLGWTATASAQSDARTDTSIAVAGPIALSVVLREGSVRIVAGTSSAVRVTARHDTAARVTVTAGGDTIALRSSAYHRRNDIVHYQVTVPAGSRIRVRVEDGMVSVAGATGDVDVSTQHGGVDVNGAAGRVTLSTVRGPIRVTDVRGFVSAIAMKGDVNILRIGGSVIAESTEGTMQLSDILGDSVRAVTVDGEITYRGRVQPSGDYAFRSHDTDVRVFVDRGVDAVIHAASVRGEVQSTISGGKPRTSRSTEIRLGNGETRIRAHSFKGSVFVLNNP